jgi:hypothetical protein
MKKKDIYKEFQRIAAEVVGENRKAQKYYVMQLCEQLGKVNHKIPFVMWCNKKRCMSFQYGLQQMKPKDSANGIYYLFRNNSQSAVQVNL